MATTRVRELTTDAEWDAAVPILCQLWHDADRSFVRSWREEDGYTLFGLSAPVEDANGTDDERERPPAEPALVAVAGVSIQRVLHHVRHAWIHDFVVDEPHRGAGYGTDLLEFVEGWARDRDCEAVALATRLDNADARGFYEARDMNRWGHVIETRL